MNPAFASELLEHTRRSLEVDAGDPSSRHRVSTADAWIVRACLEHGTGSPVQESVRCLREGVTVYCAALEHGATPRPRALGNFLLAALAIRDRSAARFLATIPETRWIDGTLSGSMARVGTLRSLVLGDEARAATWIAAAAEAEIPDAILRRDESAFLRGMIDRTQRRPDTHEAYLDYPGLGWIRLAREYGVRCAVDHPTLPVFE